MAGLSDPDSDYGWKAGSTVQDSPGRYSDTGFNDNTTFGIEIGHSEDELMPWETGGVDLKPNPDAKEMAIGDIIKLTLNCHKKSQAQSRKRFRGTVEEDKGTSEESKEGKKPRNDSSDEEALFKNGSSTLKVEPMIRSYHRYRPSAPKTRKRWTTQETNRFYRGLSWFGLNFDLMANLFPGRTPSEIRRKYRQEDAAHPTKVAKALKDKKPVDMKKYQSYKAQCDAIKREKEALEVKALGGAPIEDPLEAQGFGTGSEDNDGTEVFGDFNTDVFQHDTSWHAL